MSANEPPEYPDYGSMPDQGSTPPPPPQPQQPPAQQPPPPEQPPVSGYGPPAPPPYQPPPAAWQQPPGAPGPQYYAPPPASQKALWSMILGIGALASIPLCAGFFGLAVIASIAAIVMGAQAKGEIARSQGALSGAGQAQAGFITGIVGTALLGLGLLFFIVVFASI